MPRLAGRGARSIEHGIALDEAAVAAMAAAGTWLVPTLSCTQADGGQRPDTVAAAHRASVRLALGADVRIAMGTDNPVRPHAEVLPHPRWSSRVQWCPTVARIRGRPVVDSGPSIRAYPYRTGIQDARVEEVPR